MSNSGAGFMGPDYEDHVRFEVQVAGTAGLSDEEKEAITDFFCDKISEMTEEWKQKALDAVKQEREEKLGGVFEREDIPSGEFTAHERDVLTKGILRMMDQGPDEFRQQGAAVDADSMVRPYVEESLRPQFPDNPVHRPRTDFEFRNGSTCGPDCPNHGAHT